MNEQSSLYAHGCFPGDMIQSQRSRLGMKNQSDILLAPEVGQTEGHAHFHHTICFSYEKEGKVISELRKKLVHHSLCIYIFAPFSVTMKHTHTLTHSHF